MALDESDEISKLLIEHGADCNNQSKLGWTPLMIAAAEGNQSLCSFLLKNKANPHIRNLDGETATNIALKYHQMEIVNMLSMHKRKSVPLIPTEQKDFQSLQSIQEDAQTFEPVKNSPRTLKSKNFSVGTLKPKKTTALTNENQQHKPEYTIKLTWWRIYSKALTFFLPSCILNRTVSEDKRVQQAWREKVALCSICLYLSLFLAFITFGFSKLICKQSNNVYYQAATTIPDVTFIGGQIFSYSSLKFNHASILDMSKFSQMNSSPLFVEMNKCPVRLPPGIDCRLNHCHDPFSLKSIQPIGSIVFTWKLLESKGFVVYAGNVYDSDTYFNRDGGFLGSAINNLIKNGKGNDISRQVQRLGLNADFLFRNCFLPFYRIGKVDTSDPGCMLSNTIILFSLVLLVGIILTKFLSAVGFNWFLSKKIGKIRKKDLKSNVILFVTCYSENEKSIRTTLDSLAKTNYNDRKKLIVVVADGQITGSGNQISTPQILLDMIKCEQPEKDEAYSYTALGKGDRRRNMARVHCGFYECHGRNVPIVILNKVGVERERDLPKAGNRGKRDSQLLLMHFLSRVCMNDRMSDLDFEIFCKMHYISQIHPYNFDLVLMVDADTSVSPDSLSRMVSSMERDKMVMGLCGETRIANKRQSWVTAIQVFEYYISHHFGKAFESIFGGVTCLPGCFCMYRIKSERGGSIIPILANPDIVESYSENIVETLHRKNLLLLGEDRYLSTLMLKTFPRRKMIFVPDAVCHTVVPDTFKVLLSQRRRWINSTIHNLLELVRVNQLCGIFCFSMQFVLVLELMGTVVLPASVIFLFYLLIDVAFISGPNPANLMALGFMAAVMILQAILVLFTTRKLVYIVWMLFYLLAIPVWNFILPVYAFWHFDDFSWGETRKVVDNSADSKPVDEIEDLNSSHLNMKLWAEHVEESGHTKRYPSLSRDSSKFFSCSTLKSQEMFSNTNSKSKLLP